MNAWCGTIVMLLACSYLGIGATLTWDGSAGTDWHTAANWDANVVPGAGDDAVIPAGSTVLLAAATADLGSFTMQGGTLVFTNWTTKLSAGAIVLNGGTATLPGAFLNNKMSNRVWFVASGDFTLASGAAIDVSACGYFTSNGPGAGSSYYNVKSDGGGAGHAGRGGRGFVPASAPGGGYDSLTEPNAPGSGGGGAIPNGGYGGGVVRIEAGGTVTVNGAIRANGRAGTASAGGGSGGSVYIQCAAFGGATSGLLSVNGGNAATPAYSGGGSAGRMAVSYGTLASPCAVRFSGWPGVNGWADLDWTNRWDLSAGRGSLWLTDAGLLRESMTDGQFDGIDLYFGAGVNWTGNTLVVENSSFRLAQTNVLVTVSNDLVIGTGADFGFGGVLLQAGGNLVVTNGGRLSLFSPPTNRPPEPDYGQLVEVTGAFAVAPQSEVVLYAEPYNGGAALLRASSVGVPEGGRLFASSRGFGMNRGPGASKVETAFGSGSGHGGAGGAANYVSTAGGGVNDRVDAPVLPGSGGGGGAYESPAGGGVIRVEADTVTVDGDLLADGGHYHTASGGAGAGGTISIRCQSLGGAGLFSVAGGQGEAGGSAGGGGGGRMAVHYGTLAGAPGFTFRAPAGTGWGNVKPDSNGWFHAARPGTLFLSDTALLAESMTDGRFRDVKLYFSNATAWTASSLLVSNTTFWIGATGFTVTVSGDMVVEEGGLAAMEDYGRLVVGGNLTLANGGALRMQAGAAPLSSTNSGTLAEIGGTFSIGSGSWVYPHAQGTQGGTVLIRAGALSIASNGGVKAIARGFEHNRGPGAGRQNNTPNNLNKMSSGGGYGGRGGNTRWIELATTPKGTGGVAYGSALLPVESGSGGWKYSANGGGYGGGAIRLDVAGNAQVDGTLAADGGNGFYNYAYDGGGSGGSILLRCQGRLSGSTNALLSARGGNAGNAGVGEVNSGGGGGGRIAVWERAPFAAFEGIVEGTDVRFTTGAVASAAFEGDVRVDPGFSWENGTTNAPEAGTVRFLAYQPRSGAMILIR